jgi:hypothetical protein
MRVDMRNNDLAKLKAAIKQDSQLEALITASNEQIDAWVDANLNTIADARAIFKKILRLAAYLIREKFRETNK